MNSKDEKLESFTFKVVYSNADEEYVGLVEEFPSLSFLDYNMDGALKGIKKLVNDIIEDDAQLVSE